MRASAITLLLLWQIGPAGSGRAPSPGRHLLYQREIVLPPGASGQACVVLDAAVFAHTQSDGAGDIRIDARDAEHEFEVPFALTESGPATLDNEAAAQENVAVRNGTLVFDLSMPSGDYTDVDLDLNTKNFIGLAQVAGIAERGHSTPLGTFAVFDLSAQGLARSTILPLPDSIYPTLHVELRLFTPEGQPIVPSASMIGGATVPPAREEQTAYVTVASSSIIEPQGHWSAMTMIVPAHVPVERARFVLKPEFHESFLRDATVAASPMENGIAALGAAEGVSGHIFRVTRGGVPGVPPINSQVLSINTVIGANLRSPAKIMMSIDNGSAAPLPIARAELEMRERKLCFETRPATSYTLRYGDADLSAPSYGYARRFVAAAKPVVGILGPEQRNPNYMRSGTGEEQRSSGRDLPWILLIATISVAGVFALQYVRHRREEIG